MVKWLVLSVFSLKLPSCLVDQLGAFRLSFVASRFANAILQMGSLKSSLLKSPAVAFDHLDDMHQAFLQQTSVYLPVVCLWHIEFFEAFVQLAKQGSTCLYDPSSGTNCR